MVSDGEVAWAMTCGPGGVFVYLAIIMSLKRQDRESERKSSCEISLAKKHCNNSNTTTTAAAATTENTTTTTGKKNERKKWKTPKARPKISP